MNQGQYVFAQVIEFLSHNDFISCVMKYDGNYQIKTFTCWHQLLYIIFGQLPHREPLGDLMVPVGETNSPISASPHCTICLMPSA
jgi:hypothetical protein